MSLTTRPSGWTQITSNDWNFKSMINWCFLISFLSPWLGLNPRHLIQLANIIFSFIQRHISTIILYLFLKQTKWRDFSIWLIKYNFVRESEISTISNKTHIHIYIYVEGEGRGNELIHYFWWRLATNRYNKYNVIFFLYDISI